MGGVAEPCLNLKARIVNFGGGGKGGERKEKRKRKQKRIIFYVCCYRNRGSIVCQ